MADPLLVPAGVVVPLGLAGRAARVLGRGLRAVEVEDGVRDGDLVALLEQLERVARVARVQGDGEAVEERQRPSERLCKVCGVRPAARHRTVCRSRVCERDGYEHRVTLADLLRMNAEFDSA